MYNFIVDLFNEEEYSDLLNREEEGYKNEKTKILVVSPNLIDSPFVINKEEIDDNLLLDKYPFRYFNFNKFLNPILFLAFHPVVIRAIPGHFLFCRQCLRQSAAGKLTSSVANAQVHTFL